MLLKDSDFLKRARIYLTCFLEDRITVHKYSVITGKQNLRENVLLNLELPRLREKSSPKLSIQTESLNIYSSILELAKRLLFSNIPRKVNSFDKRITCVIESTNGSLVHMIISEAMFHMWL